TRLWTGGRAPRYGPAGPGRRRPAGGGKARRRSASPRRTRPGCAGRGPGGAHPPPARRPPPPARPRPMPRPAGRVRRPARRYGGPGVRSWIWPCRGRYPRRPPSHPARQPVPAGKADGGPGTVHRKVSVKVAMMAHVLEADKHDVIEVRGARENNLKNVSVDIPKRRLTVFTGVSG